MEYYVHPSAIVDTKKIGKNTRIWAFVHILSEVEIGENCNICDHCFIEQKVEIGNDVTIKSGIYIWEGVKLEDNVFLGPNVVFTNDVRPRSKQFIESVPTLIKKGASIGANSTVLAGVVVGEYAMTGIGSVITKDVPNHALVYGNPARIKGWVDKEGNKLNMLENNIYQSPNGSKFMLTEKGMQEL
jgi:acetyltransferase-like isoleucine patch superfamily enzyme